MEFEFERRRITKEDVRELIYREILEYHPKMLKEFLEGAEPTGFMYPSAVDKFKKQFAYLEEHYGNGAAAPPERQHSSSLPRCRPGVLYSDHSNPAPAELANDLSKCSIEEAETRFPGQVPQNIQAEAAARPGKVIGSVLRYNNCGATAASAETTEPRKVVRNPGIPAQYLVPGSSYPRKHPSCKNERGEDGPEGSNGMQPKPDLYVGRKVAAQGGNGSHWY